MRTTLDIEDDVLMAAKETARRNKLSIGAVISDLARRTLTAQSTSQGRRRETRHPGLAKLGIEPLPRRGGVVTNEIINQLRDDGIY
jgi:hypothetical protein